MKHSNNSINSKIEKIYVFMVSDNDYYPILYQALFSLCNNSSKSIYLFLVSDNLYEESIYNIRVLLEKYDGSLIIIPKPELDDVSVTGKYKLTTYYRIKLAELLPSNIERVLYLDCDILVKGDVAQIFEFDLCGKTIGGCWDVVSPKIRFLTGLDKDDVYVNAGVLLIDVNRWRKKEYEDKAIAYIKEKKGHVILNDQGVINHICKGDICVLPLNYNTTWLYEKFSYFQVKNIIKSNVYYNKQEYYLMLRDIVIIHFAGAEFLRPWNRGNVSKHNGDFKVNCSLAGCVYNEKQIKYKFKDIMRKQMYRFPTCISYLLYIIFGW